MNIKGILLLALLVLALGATFAEATSWQVSDMERENRRWEIRNRYLGLTSKENPYWTTTERGNAMIAVRYARIEAKRADGLKINPYLSQEDNLAQVQISNSYNVAFGTMKRDAAQYETYCQIAGSRKTMSISELKDSGLTASRCWTLRTYL